MTDPDNLQVNLPYSDIMVGKCVFEDVCVCACVDVHAYVCERREYKDGEMNGVSFALFSSLCCLRFNRLINTDKNK